MDLYSLNDFYLLYLIKEGSEIAEALLYKKYNAYIYNMIRELNVFKKYYDDFYQEGLIAICNAINSYDMDSNCSFFNYLYVIMRRRFFRYYKYLCSLELPYSNVFDVLEEDAIKYNSTPSRELDYYELGLSLLKTKLDRAVYYYLYKEGYTPSMISEVLNIDVKRIYNTIQKIKGLLQELKY